MKKLMLAALASTLLGGCSHQPSSGSQSRVEDSDYVSVGTNIPRKRSQGAPRTATVGAEEVENARMEGK